MKNSKKSLIFVLSAVILSAGCQNQPDNQNSSLPVYSKSETSAVVSNTESSSEQSDVQSDKEKLNEEAQTKIRDEYLTLITTFSAEESNHTLECYTSQLIDEENIVPWYEADCYIEKDADGNVVRIAEGTTYQPAYGAFYPRKYILIYNDQGRYAYLFRYLMNEEQPKLYIYNDIDAKEAYSLVGYEYHDDNDNSESIEESSSDGLPEGSIEDLDVVLISIDPYIAYNKSDLVKDSDNYYVVDSVRLVDLKKANVKYNDIDSVKNADEFDNDKKYWGERKPFESENFMKITDEQYIVEMKAGSSVDNLIIKSCYSCYGDGLFKEDENSDKYYNHIAPLNKQDIIFEGEVTLKGYAFLDSGNNIVFSPYASSFADNFSFVPSTSIKSFFSSTVYDMRYIEDPEREFVYTFIDNTRMDITNGPLSANDFNDKFVCEVTVTIKNPELYYNGVGTGNVQSGLYGTVLSVEKIREIF